MRNGLVFIVPITGDISTQKPGPRLRRFIIYTHTSTTFRGTIGVTYLLTSGVQYLLGLGAVYPLDLRGGGIMHKRVLLEDKYIEIYLQHRAGVKIPKITMSALVRTDNQSRDGGD